jgi:hypothetical protein
MSAFGGSQTLFAVVLVPQAFPQFSRRKKRAGVNSGVNNWAISLCPCGGSPTSEISQKIGLISQAALQRFCYQSPNGVAINVRPLDASNSRYYDYYHHGDRLRGGTDAIN